MTTITRRAEEQLLKKKRGLHLQRKHEEMHEQMHGQFLTKLEEASAGTEVCWPTTQLKSSPLQPCREFHEDKSAGSPFCRMCNTIGESVTKLISEYTKLVEKESAIMKMWKIGLRRLDRAEKWWEKQPNRKLSHGAKRTGCSRRRLSL